MVRLWHWIFANQLAATLRRLLLIQIISVTAASPGTTLPCKKGWAMLHLFAFFLAVFGPSAARWTTFVVIGALALGIYLEYAASLHKSTVSSVRNGVVSVVSFGVRIQRVAAIEVVIALKGTVKGFVNSVVLEGAEILVVSHEHRD